MGFLEPFFSEPVFSMNFKNMLRPALFDIKEKGKELVISAELPGMDKKNIEITVTRNSITIKAEKEKQKEGKEQGYHYTERGYSGFYRSMHLPAEVDSKNVKAVYKDGILQIFLKKLKTSKKQETKVRIQ